MLPDFLKRLLPGSLQRPGDDSWPDALREYAASRPRVAKRTALDDVRFVVFDSETTGLDLAKNRLLSIAGVAMKGPEVQLGDTFEAMVSQPDVGGADAAVIHGLVSNDLVGGLPEDEAAARFLAYCGDAVLVAHHAAFDMHMLKKAITAYRGVKVRNPVVDTAQLAKRVENGPLTSSQARGADQRKAYQLDSLVRRYGIEVPERHTAAGDALATALLFQILLRKAERRGIRTLGELLAR